MDQIARRAVTEGSDLLTPIDRNDIKSKVKQQAANKWKEKWRLTENNKLREITDAISELPYTSSQNREWERALTRIRVGHSKLTHSYLMSRSEQPYCDDCLVPLTMKHVIAECPNHQSKRNEFIANHQNSLRKILSLDCSFGGPVYKYITSIDILNQI